MSNGVPLVLLMSIGISVVLFRSNGVPLVLLTSSGISVVLFMSNAVPAIVLSNTSPNYEQWGACSPIYEQGCAS